MKKNLQALLVSCIAFCNAGCFQNFYKATGPARQTNASKAATLDSLQAGHKYFILRNGSYAFAMRAVKASEDQTSISSILDSLPSNHWLHLSNGRHNHMGYKKKIDNTLFSEVHIYIPEDSLITTGNFTVPLEKIQKIEILEKDRKKTTTNHVLSIVGVTAGTALALTALAAVLISSIQDSFSFHF
jgi:hypothetical protein